MIKIQQTLIFQKWKKKKTKKKTLGRCRKMTKLISGTNLEFDEFS